MSRRERAEAVKAACSEEWRTRAGKVEKLDRTASRRMVVDREPELITNGEGEIVGVDAWVRLFDQSGNEIPIDPHRRIINPPTVPRSGVRIIGEGENERRELTPNPLAAFWEAVWDSVESVPNAKGWRTRGTVTTVFGEANDGQVRGSDASYATARAGSGTLQALGGCTVGQSNTASVYFLYECFIGFDTSSIPDADPVSSVLLEMYLTADNSNTDFTIQVRERDWGGTVTTGDWVSSVASTQVASLNTSGIGATGSYKSFTSDAAFLTTTNMKTGTCRFILISTEQQNNSAPAVGDFEQVTFSDADTAGTTQDPKLTITHGTSDVTVELQGTLPALTGSFNIDVDVPTPTDILIGARVKAADFPPTVWDADDTDILNIAATTFTTGTPEVSVTAVAPTTGRVLVIVGGGLRNNTGADQVFLGCEIRETNASGTVVRSPSITGEDTLSCADESTSTEHKSRAFVQSGLTPGTTYFYRVQYRASTGGGTADVSARSIIVQPIP